MITIGDTNDYKTTMKQWIIYFREQNELDYDEPNYNPIQETIKEAATSSDASRELYSEIENIQIIDIFLMRSLGPDTH
jgi:hypothetical protein